MPARFTDKTDAQIECWNLVEETARDAFRRYGFEEIRTPIIERTELFERGIGTDTDVNKEMYTFDDRDGRGVTGVIVRINQRTATIGTGDGGNWRVPFHMLRHVLDI